MRHLRLWHPVGDSCKRRFPGQDAEVIARQRQCHTIVTDGKKFKLHLTIRYFSCIAIGNGSGSDPKSLLSKCWNIHAEGVNRAFMTVHVILRKIILNLINW